MNFLGGYPGLCHFLKCFWPPRGKKYFFFQNWPKSGLVSEKTRRKVFNFSGNREGVTGLALKLKYFSFFVFLLLKASLTSQKKVKVLSKFLQNAVKSYDLKKEKLSQLRLLGASDLDFRILRTSLFCLLSVPVNNGLAKLFVLRHGCFVLPCWASCLFSLSQFVVLLV